MMQNIKFSNTLKIAKMFEIIARISPIKLELARRLYEGREDRVDLEVFMRYTLYIYLAEINAMGKE